MHKLYLSIICLLVFVATSAWSQETESEYFALYFDNSRCGYSKQERQVNGDRVTNIDNTYLEIKRVGMALKIKMKETTFETITGKPLGFIVEQDMSVMRMSIKGDIGPDGTMEITIDNAGDIQKKTMPYPEGALMTEGLDQINRKHGLKQGTNYSALAFSPSAMQAIEITFNIGPTKEADLLGRVVELTEITGEYHMPGADTSYKAYVDQDFNALKMTMPVAGMVIEMVACSKEFAMSGIEAKEMVSSMIIESPQMISDIRNVKSVAYTLKPKDPNSKINFPVTNNQSVNVMADGRIRLTVSPARGDSNATFPYRGSDPEILKALESTTYLQADHPEIIRLAREAVSGKKTAFEGAMAIEAFVADYIDTKDLSVGFASALEVAKSRQGDCTEHAVLTAALCRAAGIPAQVVMGIAYIDNFLGIPSCFGGHAWTRAYVGDKWIGLDAAFKSTGRGGYDPGHIAMAIGNGEPGDFFGLLGSLGLFTIESIEIER